MGKGARFCGLGRGEVEGMLIGRGWVSGWVGGWVAGDVSGSAALTLARGSWLQCHCIWITVLDRTQAVRCMLACLLPACRLLIV